MIPLKNIVARFKKILSFFKKKSKSNELLERLEKRINYHFYNTDLLAHALIHKSFVSQDDKKGLCSNERLEFFGDAVLNCLVTEHIYNRYPEFSEGQLSKIKSLIVSRKIIGKIGKSIDLGSFLSMGLSEKKSGGQKRASIISNAFEAVLGAVYIDGGINAARTLLEKLLFNRIDQFINDKGNINYKSKILELSQADGLGVPSYPLLSTEGPDHEKQFAVGIDIAGVRLGEGVGSNKKDAQQNAAKVAIKKYSKEYIKTNVNKGEDKK